MYKEQRGMLDRVWNDPHSVWLDNEAFNMDKLLNLVSFPFMTNWKHSEDADDNLIVRFRQKVLHEIKKCRKKTAISLIMTDLFVSDRLSFKCALRKILQVLAKDLGMKIDVIAEKGRVNISYNEWTPLLYCMGPRISGLFWKMFQVNGRIMNTERRAFCSLYNYFVNLMCKPVIVAVIFIGMVGGGRAFALIRCDN